MLGSITPAGGAGVGWSGTEGVGWSGAEGDAMEEAKAINKSLSALGDVLDALHESAGGAGGAPARQHVPFRNSKLTHMLQPCLGGQAKVLFIATLSLEPEHLPETICSLRFAEKVSRTAPGVAPSPAVVAAAAGTKRPAHGDPKAPAARRRTKA